MWSSVALRGDFAASQPASRTGETRSRRAVLRLAAGLAGLGLLAACSGDPSTQSGSSPVTLRIGGNKGTKRKAKFGSGRGRR